jgi:hypothetical protein
MPQESLGGKKYTPAVKSCALMFLTKWGNGQKHTKPIISGA